MTQEQKDLLLKDISARLPYGVKCAEVYPDGNKFENEWDIIRISKYVEDGIHISNCKTTYGYCSSIENIKPYLFPISSITDEQRNEFPFEFSLLNAFINGYIYMFEDEELTVDDIIRMLDCLNRNNIDYRGLIDKGLAIDATGLNIY